MLSAFNASNRILNSENRHIKRINFFIQLFVIFMVCIIISFKLLDRKTYVKKYLNTYNYYKCKPLVSYSLIKLKQKVSVCRQNII